MSIHIRSNGFKTMLTFKPYINEMGKSDEREVESQAVRALEHLLKLRYLPDHLVSHNERIWVLSVRDARRQLRKQLHHHRSLKRILKPADIEAYYAVALKRVDEEYPEFKSNFPAHCPFFVEDLD